MGSVYCYKANFETQGPIFDYTMKTKMPHNPINDKIHGIYIIDVLLSGCCQKRGTGYCCLVSLVLGVLILILGVVLLISGESILSGAILRSMALTEGSDRLASWLNPPVQAHLEGNTLLSRSFFFTSVFQVTRSMLRIPTRLCRAPSPG